MKKIKINNKRKEALIFTALALAFICSCIHANAEQCLSDCGHYDPSAANPYCGDGKIQGPETPRYGYVGNIEIGEDCEKDDDCVPGEKCIYCQCIAPHELKYNDVPTNPDETICMTNNGGHLLTFMGPLGGSTCEFFTVQDNPSIGINSLDYIVDEALDCCESTSSRYGLHTRIVSPAHKEYCISAHSYDPQNTSDCLTFFIAAGLYDGYFHPDKNKIQWMKGYFEPEVSGCCGGFYGESDCIENNGISGECSPMENYWNDKVIKLTCNDPDCKKVDQPAFKSNAILNTGTCADWSALTTTLLRKTGYFKAHNSDELQNKVFSTDVLGHAFNLVWMDRVGKWVFLDYGKLLPDPETWTTTRLDYCDMRAMTTASDTLSRSYAASLYGFIDWKNTHVYGCDPNK